MGEYIIGRYEEYFYRNIEELIQEVLNELNGYVMCNETYMMGVKKLEEGLRHMVLMDRYLNFTWNISVYGDTIMIYFNDKVMRKSDRCVIFFDRDIGYINVDWEGDK